MCCRAPQEHLEAADEAVERDHVDAHALDVAVVVGMSSSSDLVQKEVASQLLEQWQGPRKGSSWEGVRQAVHADRGAAQARGPFPSRMLHAVAKEDSELHAWQGVPVPPRALQGGVIEAQERQDAHGLQKLQRDAKREPLLHCGQRQTEPCVSELVSQTPYGCGIWLAAPMT